MALNLEQQTTYSIRPGLSLSSNLTSEETHENTDSAQKNKFHLLSRQLPRSTTKLSRELLDNGAGLKARFSETRSNANEEENSKRAIVLEADSKDQKTSCTYEGEFEQTASESMEGSLLVIDDGQEIDCVLIYDEETKAFVIERVTSSVVVKSGVVNGASGISGGTSTGLLALPSKRHNPNKEKGRGTSSTAARGDNAQASMDDESSEDELAKELEGMLDDVSDMGDPLSASSAKQSRKASAGKQKQSQSWENIEDQLNMELAENLDEALLDVAASDDDDFEEVDSAQFVSSEKNAKGLDADIESLPDDGPSDDEDDEMVFEEVDPSSAASIRGTADNGGPQNKSRGSDLILEEDFEDFEEIGSPRTAQSSAFDDALFGGSVASTPPTGDSMANPATNVAAGFNKPTDASAENNADDFVELEFD
ncbi:hypothetical protein LPJ64_000196 [Coemansia asiatica]|uniref:Transcription elongation factor Eaf N-terminal domain-containing protein n=1 Tax=Coemansia asiatica TaxID=1052880 RepID=A0A9W7XSB9_9FUNG|nr:hypothetical protein LPJ64_000196 [Coemansia asiatica]